MRHRSFLRASVEPSHRPRLSLSHLHTGPVTMVLIRAPPPRRLRVPQERGAAVGRRGRIVRRGGRRLAVGAAGCMVKFIGLEVQHHPERVGRAAEDAAPENAHWLFCFASNFVPTTFFSKRSLPANQRVRLVCSSTAHVAHSARLCLPTEAPRAVPPKHTHPLSSTAVAPDADVKTPQSRPPPAPHTHHTREKEVGEGWLSEGLGGGGAHGRGIALPSWSGAWSRGRTPARSPPAAAFVK